MISARVNFRISVGQGFPSNLRQLRHTTANDPFDAEDVAVLVEAGVVRVDESSVLPLGAFASEAGAQCLGTPLFIVAEVGEDLVVFVQQRNTCVQVGHQHQVTLHIDVSRKQETAHNGSRYLSNF